MALLLAALLLSSLCGAAAVAPAPASAPAAGSFCRQPGWNLVWSDDFNGQELNSSNWNIMVGRDEGTLRQALGTREDVYVEGGKLVLRTRLDGFDRTVPRPTNCSTLLPDTDVRGGYGVATTSAKDVGECCAQCRGNPVCASFVYLPGGAHCKVGCCYQKSADALTIVPGQTGRTAGFVPGAGMYKSGAVISGGQTGSKVPQGNADRAWKRGRFCVSAKLPGFSAGPLSPNADDRSKGIWPAHWLMPNVQDCWPTRGEIDVTEMVNGDGQYHGTYHWSGDGKCNSDAAKGGGTSAPADFATAFHEYALEWDQDRMDFVVDGAVQFTVRSGDQADYGGPRGAEFFDVPYYWLLNTAVGSQGSWAGLPGNQTVFPQYHYIDYVQVAQRPAEAAKPAILV